MVSSERPKVKDDPMAVRWLEKHHETMDKLWARVPSFMRSSIVTIAVFALGATIRGEWLLFLMHGLRQLGLIQEPSAVSSTPGASFWSQVTPYFKDLHVYIIGASVVAYSMYFLIGGFIQWYFYVRQRDRPQDWKCQPNKFLETELEVDEIMVGSFSLLVTNTFSGALACFVSNGGYSTIYYNVSDYGWLWFFLQWPVIFLYQDYVTYWMHRIYHLPFLYRHFHKMHHKYKQPTAFSVTAIHPVEILSMQIVLCLPIFVLPTHWFPFYIIALYTYYHGIIDHSGVNFKAYWWQPWQPDAIFHDNHHQYFHVNFGFNIFIWDKIHGTYRRKDRIYKEDVFYGKGKALNEATTEELNEDIQQRLSENPLAYRSNKLDFKLGKTDIKAKSK